MSTTSTTTDTSFLNIDSSPFKPHHNLVTIEFKEPKTITLFGRSFTEKTGLFILLHPPAEKKYYTDGVFRLTILRERIIKIKTWFEMIRYQFNCLNELGYDKCSQQHLLKEQTNLQFLTNLKPSDIASEENLSKAIQTETVNLYHLCRKRFDLNNKAQKIDELMKKITKSLDDFKQLCGEINDKEREVAPDPFCSELPLLKEIVSLGSLITNEVDVLKFIVDTYHSNKLVNKFLVSINNRIISCQAQTFGQLHQNLITKVPPTQNPLKDSLIEATLSWIELQGKERENLLSSMKLLSVSPTLTLSDEIDVEDGDTNKEKMDTIDTSLCELALLSHKIALIYQSHQRLFSTIRGLAEPLRAKSLYLCMKKEAEGLLGKIDGLTIPKTVMKLAEQLDDEMLTAKAKIIDMLMMQRTLKQEEDEFKKWDAMSHEWFTKHPSKTTGSDNFQSCKSILNLYPQVGEAEKLIPKGHDLLKELQDFLYYQYENLDKIEWTRDEISNHFKNFKGFEGYALLLASDANTLFAQSKESYNEKVERAGIFYGNIKETLKSFVGILHGLIWKKEQFTLAIEGVNSYLTSATAVLNKLSTLCDQSELKKPMESDYLTKIQTKLDFVIADRDRVLITLNSFQETQKLQARSETAEIICSEAFFQMSKKVIFDFYPQQEKLLTTHENDLKTLEAKKTVAFHSIDKAIEVSKTNESTLYDDKAKEQRIEQIRLNQVKIDCEMRLAKLGALHNSIRTMIAELKKLSSENTGEHIINNPHLISLLPTDDKDLVDEVTKAFEKSGRLKEAIQDAFESYTKALSYSYWDYIPGMSDRDERKVKMTLAAHEWKTLSEQLSQFSTDFGILEKTIKTRIQNLEDAIATVMQTGLSLHLLSKSLDGTLLQIKEAFEKQQKWVSDHPSNLKV